MYYISRQKMPTYLFAIWSYQWERPTLEQQLPKVIRLTPIQAAGKMYTLSEISAMPISAFQVQLNTKEKKNYIVITMPWIPFAKI